MFVALQTPDAVARAALVKHLLLRHVACDAATIPPPPAGTTDWRAVLRQQPLTFVVHVLRVPAPWVHEAAAARHAASLAPAKQAQQVCARALSKQAPICPYVGPYLGPYPGP